MEIQGNPEELQAAKDVVLRFTDALDAATGAESASVLSAHVTDDYLWRGMHPFGERRGAAEVAEVFWHPLRTALTSMQRRPDIFFAGRNMMDDWGSLWTASSGHLMALFDSPWLGIAPTGKLVMLRYAEFHRVEGGRIAETALFVDIPHLMIQAGRDPFPHATAAHLVQPGPRGHDGILLGPSDPAEGAATLAAITATRLR